MVFLIRLVFPLVDEFIGREVVFFHFLSDGGDGRRVDEGGLHERFLQADRYRLQRPRGLIVGTLFHTFGYRFVCKFHLSSAPGGHQKKSPDENRFHRELCGLVQVIRRTKVGISKQFAKFIQKISEFIVKVTKKPPFGGSWRRFFRPDRARERRLFFLAQKSVVDTLAFCKPNEKSQAININLN